MAASHFLLFYDYPGDVLERRAPHREGHLELIRSWKDDGRLLMAGAVGDPPSGGLFVFLVEDPAEIDAFTEADPYVKESVITGRRVEPWKVV
jgi:uncharacterized protein YciI